MTAETDADVDLLYGMPAIAEFLGMELDQARHLARQGEFPTFKIRKLRCARRSTLRRWLADLEAAAMAERANDA